MNKKTNMSILAMAIQKNKNKLYKEKKTENQSLVDNERMNCNRKAHKEKKNFNYLERKYLPTRGKGK
jgi:hypothetical protein